MAHAIVARAKASVNRPLRPGNRGGNGGRYRERGALTEAAVVVTLTMTLVAELPAVTGFGETVQVASEGAPVQVKLTVPDNPQLAKLTVVVLRATLEHRRADPRTLQVRTSKASPVLRFDVRTSKTG